MLQLQYFNPATQRWEASPPRDPIELGTRPGDYLTQQEISKTQLDFKKAEQARKAETQARMTAQAFPAPITTLAAAPKIQPVEKQTLVLNTKTSATPLVITIDKPSADLSPEDKKAAFDRSVAQALSEVKEPQIIPKLSGTVAKELAKIEATKQAAADEKDMSFLGIDLSGLVAKAAPKIVENVIVGGDSDDKEVLKAALNSELAKPVFQKFGNDFETGAKIAGSIATVAGGVLGLKNSDGKSLTTNILPTQGKTFGDILAAGKEQIDKLFGSSDEKDNAPSPSGISTIALLIIAAVLLFRKKLLRILR